MAAKENPHVSLFKQKAAVVGAQVVEVKGLQEAMAYALDVCEKKDFCELVLSGCGENLSEKGAAYCKKADVKMIAAPGLDEAVFKKFEAKGKEKGFTVIRNGMREYLAGIDVGFTTAEMGVAETGTCIMPAEKEDLRLSTMVCEIHVIALSKSTIVQSLYDAEDYLQKLMEKGIMYTAFVSGPSRTADIERVLAIGVHGPLEVHVALMEE